MKVVSKRQYIKALLIISIMIMPLFLMMSVLHAQEMSSESFRNEQYAKLDYKTWNKVKRDFLGRYILSGKPLSGLINSNYTNTNENAIMSFTNDTTGEVGTLNIHYLLKDYKKNYNKWRAKPGRFADWPSEGPRRFGAGDGQRQWLPYELNHKSPIGHLTDMAHSIHVIYRDDDPKDKRAMRKKADDFKDFLLIAAKAQGLESASRGKKAESIAQSFQASLCNHKDDLLSHESGRARESVMEYAYRHVIAFHPQFEMPTAFQNCIPESLRTPSVPGGMRTESIPRDEVDGSCPPEKKAGMDGHNLNNTGRVARAIARTASEVFLDDLKAAIQNEFSDRGFRAEDKSSKDYLDYVTGRNICGTYIFNEYYCRGHQEKNQYWDQFSSLRHNREKCERIRSLICSQSSRLVSNMINTYYPPSPSHSRPAPAGGSTDDIWYRLPVSERTRRMGESFRRNAGQ